MKKFALAAVAAAALSAGVAQAYTVGTFSDGVVVPNVIHNGPTDTTAVGLINQSPTVVPVFWTFFDQNSNHVTDGCFPMTPKDYEPFVWSSASGLGLEGKRGYLVFAVGATPAGISVANACQAANSAAINGAGLIAANAFRWMPPTRTWRSFSDRRPSGYRGDLSTMGPNSLFVALGARSFGGPGPAAAPVFSMRYFIDGAAGGNDTGVVVWSTGDQRGTHTVNMFDDKQNRKSVNFKLNFAELDYFDPETIPGRPASFVDGFIDGTHLLPFLRTSQLLLLEPCLPWVVPPSPTA
jgi:hypothetical protein